MPTKFILQGLTTDSHLDEIRDIFQLDDIDRIVISVAFLNERGFALLADLLAPVAEKTTVFAGIRNGITSAQGLLASLDCGCTTYAVDTGSRGIIFHPKIYLAKNPSEAHLVLGSANLTVGGLHGNIEAGIRINADMSVDADAELVDDLLTKIDAMPSDFPDHVFELSDKDQVLELLEAGRVIDEARALPPTPGGSSADRNLDRVPKMGLKKKRLKLAPITSLGRDEESEEGTASEDEDLASTGTAAGGSPVTPPSRPVTEALELVWVSSPLTRRPLNIPTAQKTNPTGSMYFSKGQTDDIDQRHYFREEVFADLDWSHDLAPGKTHLERATARFRIVIKDVNYGVFSMSLTHDSRTDSATYRQNNSVTQLHWGEVKSLVARDDLLGRTMYLYRDAERPGQFVLEID